MIVVLVSWPRMSIRGKPSRLPFCEVFATFCAAKAAVASRAADNTIPNVNFFPIGWLAPIDDPGAIAVRRLFHDAFPKRVAGCGKKDFPPPAPSFWSHPE